MGATYSWPRGVLQKGEPLWLPANAKGPCQVLKITKASEVVSEGSAGVRYRQKQGGRGDTTPWRITYAEVLS